MTNEDDPELRQSCPTRKRIQADARDGLKMLAASSVQCAVTSPPYYWQRDYDHVGQLGHEPTPDAYVKSLVEVFRELRRVLRLDGVLFLNLGDTYYSAKGRPVGGDDSQRKRGFSRRVLRAVDAPGLGLPRKSLIGIPWRVALAMQSDGWTLRANVVWHKVGAQPEPSARDRPWQDHEHVFVFARSPRYYFNRSALDGEESVWRIPSARAAGGPAPFPAALVERCIACGSRPDDLVIDPFCGSGTVLEVAARMGRRAVGIDLSADSH